MATTNTEDRRLPRLGLRLASSGALVVVSFWLLLGNLSCVWTTINTFAIKFDPEHFFVDSPGKSGSVLAELIWAGEGGKPLEALSWSVEPGIPKILTSATCSPDSESDFTTVYLQCSDDSAQFAPSDLWVASKESAYRVGVKARFVDPVWKSLSEGQEAVIARKAYLPIRAGMPQIVIRNDGWGKGMAAGDLIYTLHVVNHLEGWKYFFTQETRGISDHDVSFFSSDLRQELFPNDSLGKVSYAPVANAKKAAVRFYLEFYGPKGLVSKEVRNYPIGSTL